MTKWLAFSCTEFALVSRDVGHPLYDVARQNLYIFIMAPILGEKLDTQSDHSTVHTQGNVYYT
jgi:hypothetical protein